MAEKVTVMNLKVELQCVKCYKKVKKILCKFPQIRDQVYDEKRDIVTIRVVCCSPEKLRDKLCCQGGGSIKSIEIVEPPKPKPPEKPKEPEKPKQPEKPKEPERPRPPPPPPPDEPIIHGVPTPRRIPPAVKFPEPVPTSVLAYPSPTASVDLFYEGGPGGPQGFYGRPIYDSYGGDGPCYGGSYHQQLCEDDASVCTVT